MYEQMGYGCALLTVGCFALKDVKERQIPIVWVVGCGIVAVVYLMMGEKINIVFLIQSMMPGMLLLLCALLTKESIGYGDGVVVLLLGLWCGGLFAALAAGIALFLTGFYAVFLLLKRCKKTIPFLPFLLIGMEVVFLYA